MSAAYHQYIREAVAQGCYFDFATNSFVSWTGRPRKTKKYGTQRYPSITLRLGITFPLHKFVAYLLYGEDAFKECIVVRHLDGDTLNLSKDNIVLGTYSENEMDKSKEARSRVGKIARAAQGRPNNAKLSEQDVVEIIEWYSWMRNKYPKKMPNGSVVAVAKWYGINRGTIDAIITKRNWKDINV
jgi:hypothetical protein